MAARVRDLAAAARHTVRDMEPKDDLVVLRLRGRDKELMVAPAGDCTVVVIQRWRVAPAEDAR
jgi:dynein light chain roadblock-type